MRIVPSSTGFRIGDFKFSLGKLYWEEQNGQFEIGHKDGYTVASGHYSDFRDANNVPYGSAQALITDLKYSLNFGSVAPANLVAPTISFQGDYDEPIEGDTLIADVGQWEGSFEIIYTYQWNRDGAPIDGATESTYVAQAGDAGSELTVVVTATNNYGSTSLGSENSIAVQLLAPQILTSEVTIQSGNNYATLEDTLEASCTFLGLSPTISYQWTRDGVPIAGETGSTYSISPIDEDTAITCEITVANVYGSDSVTPTGKSVADWFIMTVQSDGDLNANDGSALPYWQAGFYFPIAGAGTGYDFVVDWGDGTVESWDENNITSSHEVGHNYTEAGTYQIGLRGVFPMWSAQAPGITDAWKNIISIERWGSVVFNTQGAFSGAENLVEVTAPDTPNFDFSAGEPLRQMFKSCSSLTSISNIENWNTTGATDMLEMFYYCIDFDANLNNWDFSSITTIRGAFEGTESFNNGGQIPTWNFTSVLQLCRNAFKSSKGFNQDISSWDVSGVIEFAATFSESVFNNGGQPLTWDVSSVLDFSSMFEGAQDFNADLSTWDTSSGTNFSSMFRGCDSFNQSIDWLDLSNASIATSLLNSCTSFNQPVNLNIGSLTNLSAFFRECTSMNSPITITGSNIIVLGSFLQDATSFDSTLTIDMTNVTQATNMLDNIAWSVANYDAFLAYLDSVVLQNNVTIGVNGLFYENNTSRSNVIADHSWVFVGDINNDVFKFTVNTELSGTGATSNNQFKLPLNTNGTFSFDVYWGDGTSDTITLHNQAETTHTYSSPGIYQIAIIGQCEGFDCYTAANSNNGDGIKITSLDKFGTAGFIFDSNTRFRSAANMVMSPTDVPNITSLDFTDVFRGCASLGAHDYSGWDVSSVADFSSCFRDADVDGSSMANWQVGTAPLTSMFQGANCPTSLDLSNWVLLNTGSFNYGYIFASSDFNDPSILTWDVSSVRNFVDMFGAANAFNQDISGWDMSSATNLSGMFRSAQAFDQDLSAWTWPAGQVTDFRSTFTQATAFNNGGQPLLWDVSGCNNFLYMFRSAEAFNQDLSSWVFPNGTSLYGFLQGAISFDQDLSGWDMEKVVQMERFLFGAGLSTPNYDATLIGWAALSLQTIINFQNTVSMGSSQYTPGGAAEAARDTIVNNVSYDWNIVDGGPV